MAIWLVILITSLAFLLLEYIIPFGRNVKGIENSSKAYYQAASGIEQALLPWSITQSNYNNPAIAYKYDIVGTWTLLPAPGEWNSEYDDDDNWNTIAPGQPIQLEIWNQLLEGGPTINIKLRVPNIDNETGTTESLSGTTLPIVNWQISSKDEFLSAIDSSWITADMINEPAEGNNWLSYINLDSKTWDTLEAGPWTIRDFYNGILPGLAGCVASQNDNPCTLKLSIVNPLFMDNGLSAYPNNTKIPYLEWQIEFNKPVPLRYAWISANGKSYGFRKQLNIKIPQQTLVEAFDFTVFQ